MHINNIQISFSPDNHSLSLHKEGCLDLMKILFSLNKSASGITHSIIFINSRQPPPMQTEGTIVRTGTFIGAA